ncbi:hypothetical protein VISI1226_15616 [Vibrio sinaloensis DSM 21326]|uniref:Ribosome recycling factor n=1 Tax=Vibrio sinaloensis DSM 21326 TaxID=945550 RepID=E8MD06_PHOS4|nr:ribosome recycling factor family protein [Vibrio sinaloensis]EGA68182.1 hypothetical protein VISI1226_15616 [Vibrio sinaloensis DSM 21326]
MLSVPLNSFVHRVNDKQQVLNLVAEHGCQLKRIRRSRHWMLSGDEDQLRLLSDQLDSVSQQWIIKAINLALPKLTISLQQVLTEQPNLTVTQLVSLTDCSMEEARRAIDEHEGF